MADQLHVHEKPSPLATTAAGRSPMASYSCAPPPPRPRLLVPKPDPDAPPPVPLTPDLSVSAAKPDPDAPATTTTTRLTADLCAALRRELEPSPYDRSDFAQSLRLTQRRLDHLSSSAPPPLPPPPPPSAHPSRASCSTVGGRKRVRGGTPSAEMVRATVPTSADLLQVRALVRRARLTFEALRGHYLRTPDPSRLDGRNRADMRALTAMLSRDLCLYHDRRIVGPVPGVFVGDVFSYRAELLVVGLHGRTQACIGYVPAGLVSEGHPVATSIVSSAGYLDDQDNGDVLVYAGSGGGGQRDADQAFERGNLALAYSCKYGVEVRVVRCHPCDASPSGKVYVYDGLYRVDSASYSPGESGRQVCRFVLLRLPGQDALGTNTWHAARKLTDALNSNIRPPGYLTLDLARGREAIRIPVCNTVDQDRSPLDDTKYITRPRFPPPPTPAERHHRCCAYAETACGGGGLSSSRSCACVKRNGGGGPAYNTDGTLVRGMPVVYECGGQCGCPPASCPNRVTQRGMRHRLEVFRSKETEWGVRALDLIQPGAFICEFSGDVVAVEDDESRRHSGNAASGLMDWDGYLDPRKFPPRWKEWGDTSAALPDEEPPRFPQCPTPPGYVLDVSEKRNFAPYICHSAAPNAFVQFVVRGDENESCPHLMVFAMETIPPMCELSIDYGIDE